MVGAMVGAMEPPVDEHELMRRARALGGRTVPEVAQMLGVPLPRRPGRAKGFVGQLAERALGGACDSRVGPDFAELGVELKTLPVDGRGRVRESTFVCTAQIAGASELDWSTSRVRRKLARVLFLAIRADLPPAERRFGAAFLWSPDAAQEAQLRADWEDLMGAVAIGQVEAIDARRGEVLQLRPKGANAAARTLAFDAEGAPILSAPKGFYLRSRFTAGLWRGASLWA